VTALVRDTLQHGTAGDGNVNHSRVIFLRTRANVGAWVICSIASSGHQVAGVSFTRSSVTVMPGR
jgi:hypothetical protein